MEPARVQAENYAQRLIARARRRGVTVTAPEIVEALRDWEGRDLAPPEAAVAYVRDALHALAARVDRGELSRPATFIGEVGSWRVQVEGLDEG